MMDHPEAARAIEQWWRVARRAEWRSLADCREIYPTADQAGRVLIFNIQGNRYRLMTVVSWAGQRIYVKALLTHSEYARNLWHKWAY
ncbi:MAG: type II toxin-antitoxin system HigB family toxin [Acidobacteria bacterium]|nr:type II toxin-antitoxin system HigB family toxin [Acidobacteriota bacterium]